MNCWKEYIEYLKDNPKGYWFRRKMYGYGWTPAKPAGWITVGIYLLFLVGLIIYQNTLGAFDNDEFPTTFISLVAVATILLIVISWRTGEPLKWQWGKKK